MIDTFSVTKTLVQNSNNIYYLPSQTTTGDDYYLLNKVLCYDGGVLKGQAEKVNINKKSKLITFVGKLNTAKGYDLFGKSIVRILNKFPDWNAVVVGDEPREKLTFFHNNLKIISVADIIQYREKREQLVKRVSEQEIDLSFGKAKIITYNTLLDDVEHIALVYGDISSGENIPTRIHKGNIIKDVFLENNIIHGSLNHLNKRGMGIILYLREGAVGVQSGNKTGRENLREAQWKDIGLGAQIIRDLKVSSIELLSSTTSHFVGLSGFGIEIKSRSPIEN